MLSERRRVLELALESLKLRKTQIDDDIADVTAELRRLGAGIVVSGKRAGAARRRSRFSEQERARRSERMKAYWEKWRKEKAHQG